jgi:hypothetical protein
MCGSHYSVRQLLYALCAMPANLSPQYKKAEGGDSATPEQPAGGADRDIQPHPPESACGKCRICHTSRHTDLDGL